MAPKRAIRFCKADYFEKSKLKYRQKGRKVRKVAFCFISFLFLSHFFVFFSMAQNDNSFSVSEKEVVFLVDVSKSMGGREDDAVTDAVRQILYSLPADIRTGLVVYNTDIQGIAEMGSEPAQTDRILSTVEYTGYSNAGLGLKQALSLFSGEEDIERHIIMVSDGEIDMKSEEESETSREEFIQEARLAAGRGIKIHIMAVDGIPDEEREILEAAEISGGEIYTEGTDGELSGIAEEIIYRQFNFPRKAVGTMEGNSGNFHIEIPVDGASRVKVLLTGKSEMENVNAGYTAESGQVVRGKQFAVVDLTGPEGAVDITFDLKEASTVEAWLTAEYRTVLDVETEYRTETVQEEEKGREPVYRHYADLEIRLLNRDSENSNLWESGYYNGHPVSYKINGENFNGKIENGAIRHTLIADGLETAEISVRTDGFYEIYREAVPVEITVELPPDPVAETDYRPLWYILGGLAAALVLILLIWIRKGKAELVYVGQPDSGKNLEKYEVKSCQYTGKLNLYVVQTPNGRDIAPQTIRLFGRKSARITLEWILNSCGIKFGNTGAGDIVFYPGPDKALVVMDQSEQCTVMRGMEILKKGIGYPVYYNEKLTVTMEDGITEMEIHYKNLKPGEREPEKR